MSLTETTPNDFRTLADSILARSNHEVMPREFIDLARIFFAYFEQGDLDVATYNVMVRILATIGARASKQGNALIGSLADDFVSAEDDWRALGPERSQEQHGWHRVKASLSEADKQYI
jgi:hypothetical protein